jgi:hypothetical protein
MTVTGPDVVTVNDPDRAVLLPPGHVTVSTPLLLVNDTCQETTTLADDSHFAEAWIIAPPQEAGLAEAGPADRASAAATPTVATMGVK